jgi:hypothetical protein
MTEPFQTLDDYLQQDYLTAVPLTAVVREMSRDATLGSKRHDEAYAATEAMTNSDVPTATLAKLALVADGMRDNAIISYTRNDSLKFYELLLEEHDADELRWSAASVLVASGFSLDYIKRLNRLAS